MSVITPDQLVGARSPIYITAGYSDLAGSITDITLEVYVWNGSRSSRPASPDYTLFRDVFAGTDVSFDIAPLVSEEIGAIYDTADRVAPIGEQDTNIVWVQIDYDVNYINKANPPQTVNDTGSSDIFPVSNGYHTFAEGANFEFPTTYLNNTSTVYVQEGGYEVMPLFMGKYNAETIEEVVYRVGGSDIFTFNIVSYHADLQPEDRILRIPFGEVGLNTWLTSSGYAGADSNRPINQTEWEMRLLDGDNTDVGTIKIVKQCESKYTINTIDYINRYGTWDYLHFFKASQDSFSTTSEQYRRSLGTSSTSGFSYDSTDEMYKQYNTNGKTRTTLNTGWVTEDHREAIKDLMMSERVLLNGSPISVVSNSANLQKSVNDKTINYTIEVEEAFDTRYV